MLVSVSKNHWIIKWLEDSYPDYNTTYMSSIVRLVSKHGDSMSLAGIQEVINKGLAKFIKSKGFKVKYHRDIDDIFITMRDQEYTFLRLKYE